MATYDTWSEEKQTVQHQIKLNQAQIYIVLHQGLRGGISEFKNVMASAILSAWVAAWLDSGHSEHIVRSCAWTKKTNLAPLQKSSLLVCYNLISNFSKIKTVRIQMVYSFIPLLKWMKIV